MHANAIIASALRKLMVVPSGVMPSSTELDDGLEALNDIISLWSANASLVYQDDFEEIIIANGTQSFTVGATGDYVAGKPVQLLNASIKTSNIEYPLNIIDRNVYQRFHDKTHTGRPLYIYFRDTHPNSTFYFDVTTDASYTLILTSIKELVQFPNGTTDVLLPSYYETALKNNLVIALADEFGASNRISQTMYQAAESSKSAVIGRALNPAVSLTEMAYINGFINKRYYNQDRNK